MKKIFLVVMIAVLTAVLCFAQGTPSSKATAAINTLVGCTVSGATTPDVNDTLPITCHDVFLGTSVDVTPDNYVSIMKSTIKVSNSQSLFVSPSLVTGLYTQTKTVTKTPTDGSTLSTSTAMAMGAVYMRAKITNQATKAVQYAFPTAACKDGVLGCWAAPGDVNYGVILDSRIQTLTQSLSNCVVNVVVGGVTGSGTCDFTSTIDLALQTTSAHSFNMIFPSVGVGVYDVEIEAAVGSKAKILAGSGTAVGGAAFGLGSVTVESVRLVHDFSF